MKASDIAALNTSIPCWKTTRRVWPYRLARTGILVIADLTALFFSASLGYVLWAYSVLGQPIEVYADVIALMLLFPLGYAAGGLYPGFGVGAVETLRRLSYCTTLGFLAVAASSFAFKLPADHSRITFFFAWSAATALIPVARFLTLSVATRTNWWCEPTLMVGNPQWLEATIRSLEHAKSIGFRPS